MQTGFVTDNDDFVGNCSKTNKSSRRNVEGKSTHQDFPPSWAVGNPAFVYRSFQNGGANLSLSSTTIHWKTLTNNNLSTVRKSVPVDEKTLFSPSPVASCYYNFKMIILICYKRFKFPIQIYRHAEMRCFSLLCTWKLCHLLRRVLK